MSNTGARSPWVTGSAVGWPLALGLALLASVLVAAMVDALLRSGPFYDEFYTLYVTRSGADFRTLFAGSWMADNHPPLYYLFAWATRWMGDGVEVRRLSNLLIVAAAAIGLFGVARRAPAHRLWLVLFAVGLCSSFAAVEFAAVLRSYFASLLASALAVAALVTCASPGRARYEGRMAFPVLAGSLLVAFNLHFVTTAIVGALAAAFAVRLLIAREWRTFRSVALAGTLAFVPFAITTLVQMRTLMGNTASFWLDGGIAAARWSIQASVEDALGGNMVLSLCGLAGLAVAAWQSWRERKLDRAIDGALVVGAGLVLALLVLVALHLWRPLLSAKYLVAMIPPILAVLALGAASLLGHFDSKRIRLLALAIPLAGLPTILRAHDAVAAYRGWYQSGDAIVLRLNQCPGTLVHVNMAPNADLLALKPDDNRMVVPFAYRQAAQSLGFALEPARSRRMAHQCPTLFWTEHAGNQRPEAERLANDLRDRGYPIGRVTLTRSRFGWVLESWPDDAQGLEPSE